MRRTKYSAERGKLQQLRRRTFDCSRGPRPKRLRLGCQPDQRRPTTYPQWEAVEDQDSAFIRISGEASGTSTSSYRRPAVAGPRPSGRPADRCRCGAAHRRHGRFCIALQNNKSNIMSAPGALWTAAHHHIPMLLIMHNNRAYHQEIVRVQQAQRASTRHNQRRHRQHAHRSRHRLRHISASHGLYAEGPITDPKDLGPALERAVERVESGETALVDVVAQPR